MTTSRAALAVARDTATLVGVRRIVAQLGQAAARARDALRAQALARCFARAAPIRTLLLQRTHAHAAMVAVQLARLLCKYDRLSPVALAAASVREHVGELRAAVGNARVAGAQHQNSSAIGHVREHACPITTLRVAQLARVPKVDVRGGAIALGESLFATVNATRSIIRATRPAMQRDDAAPVFRSVAELARRQSVGKLIAAASVSRRACSIEQDERPVGVFAHELAGVVVLGEEQARRAAAELASAIDLIDGALALEQRVRACKGSCEHEQTKGQ